MTRSVLLPGKRGISRSDPLLPAWQNRNKEERRGRGSGGHKTVPPRLRKKGLFSLCNGACLSALESVTKVLNTTAAHCHIVGRAKTVRRSVGQHLRDRRSVGPCMHALYSVRRSSAGKRGLLLLLLLAHHLCSIADAAKHSSTVGKEPPQCV